MSDRFKFRVFYQGHMYYEEFCQYLGSYGCMFPQFEKLENPLMQCTGLKDKNGKLVYEGDILDSKYKMEVFFANGAFWCRGNGHGSMLLSSYLVNRNHAKTPVEVIGNIYENPELLEQ